VLARFRDPDGRATFDEASATIGAGFLRTMRRINLPMIWPSIVSVGVFFFMRSRVTLAAVVFLFTPTTQLAAHLLLRLVGVRNVSLIR
jgi:iron(III) transport system permease protein